MHHAIKIINTQNHILCAKRIEKTRGKDYIIARLCSFNPLFVFLLWYKLHIFMTYSDSFTFVYYWLNVGYCAAHGVQPWTVNWTKIHSNSQNETLYCCHKYKHLKVETDKICSFILIVFLFRCQSFVFHFDAFQTSCVCFSVNNNDWIHYSVLILLFFHSPYIQLILYHDMCTKIAVDLTRKSFPMENQAFIGWRMLWKLHSVSVTRWQFSLSSICMFHFTTPPMWLVHSYNCEFFNFACTNLFVLFLLNLCTIINIACYRVHFRFHRHTLDWFVSLMCLFFSNIEFDAFSQLKLQHVFDLLDEQINNIEFSSNFIFIMWMAS